jgi:hypothetical protein
MNQSGFVIGLTDAANNPITDMGADWTSKWYGFGKFKHVAVHLGWTNLLIEGTLYLDYSCDPDGVIYTVKNVILLDGTFNEDLFIDANLAINNYRFRFEHTVGAGTVTAFHNYKN